MKTSRYSDSQILSILKQIIEWRCRQHAIRCNNESKYVSHQLHNQVQDFATRWLRTYNTDRPNMGICGSTAKRKLIKAV